MKLLIGIILLLQITLSIAFGFGSSDRVLLEKGMVLTFESGKQTNARRVSSIPQLQCIGGKAKGKNSLYPDIVQCVAQGSDGYDMQWKCDAELDNSVRFGKTEVSCEGYSSSDDPYILRGSCGLEYTLELTNAGNQKYQSGNAYDTYKDSYASGPYNNYDSSSRSSTFGKLIMFAVVAFILFSVARSCALRNNASYQQPGGSNYPGGGFPGGNHGDHPGGNDNNGNGGFPGYPKTNSYSSSYGTGYTQPNTGYTQGPGFWSGLGGGGLLGYLLGRSMRPSTGYGYGMNAPRYNSGYSGFGAPSSYRPSFGGSSFSSGSRSSSGFGGTRRR